MTIVVLEMHSEEELENSKPEVYPHSITETKAVWLDSFCGTIYPEAEDHKNWGGKYQMYHVYIWKRKRKPAAFYFVFCDYANSTNDGINMQNYGKDAGKK